MLNYDDYSLIIGRFQPLHLGHMDMIRKCASESNHLIIGIGSAQYSNTSENPFTAGERYLMLSNALKDDGIGNFSIVPVDDINDYPKWVAHVVSVVPPFQKVYTNNPVTKRLFIDAGYEVRSSPWYNRESYSGTEIRRRMASDEEWRSLVPESVSKVMDDIGGVDRMKRIMGVME